MLGFTIKDIVATIYAEEKIMAAKQGLSEYVEGRARRFAYVELYVEQDSDICLVRISADHLGLLLRFNFNPGSPQDAKQFYTALLEARSIIAE